MEERYQLQPVPQWIRRILYWAFWTTVAVLNAATVMIENPALPRWKPLLWELSSLYTIGAIYPLVAYVTRRFPLSKRPRLAMLALHGVFLLTFSGAHTSVMVAIRKLGYLMVGESYRFGGGIRVLYEFYKDLVLYPLLVALTAGMDYYRKYRENELRSEQLQRRLTEAQFQNLRGQLNPHFLFNTLNMISARMYEDVADADRMIARLGDLLRMTLRNSEPEVPLRTEQEMLELYVDIMKARFQDSIRVQIEIDPAAHQVMVPSLLLQPLVENAFRHGTGVKPGGGLIEVLGHAQNGTLNLVVRDDGPGMDGDVQKLAKQGVGLSNVTERLRQLYGERQVMEVRNRPDAEGGGLEVRIEIPARRSH